MTESSSPVRTDWDSLHSPTEVADAIVELFDRKGSARYDEAVSQLEHALQCGAYAMVARADEPTVVAAFLHDIGHLVTDERGLDERGGGAAGGHDRHHEELGAEFVAAWFPQSVAGPIRLHVPAKRYLCAIERTYHDGLSPASVRSLELQGGPMSRLELQRYGAMLHSEAATELRRWDDLAKVPGAPTPSLDVFHAAMVDVLTGT